MASVLRLPALPSPQEARDEARPQTHDLFDDAAEPTPTPLFELPVAEPFPGFNRRFMPRTRREFPVVDQITREKACGIDLSFGGMMVSAAEPVWPGNTVSYALHLEESGIIAVTGTVVELVAHRGQLAMRVSFDELSIAERRTIADWMARGAGV